MSNIFEIIDSLAASGINIYMQADKLSAAPKSSITEEIRHQIKSRKNGLVAALALINPATDSKDSPPLTARIFWANHQPYFFATGWTASSFWQQHPQPGVGWALLWKDPTWRVELDQDGVITFLCQRNGRPIIQRAWPPQQ